MTKYASHSVSGGASCASARAVGAKTTAASAAASKKLSLRFKTISSFSDAYSQNDGGQANARAAQTIPLGLIIMHPTRPGQ